MDDTFPKLLVSSAARVSPKKVAFREKKFGIWHEVTWQEYRDLVRIQSLGLLELGFQRGDRLALIGSNRRDLFVAALAGQAAGGVVVGIYQDASARETQQILASTGATMVIAEDQEQVDKVLEIKHGLPALRRIIYYVPRGMEYYDDPLLLPLADLRTQGQAALARSPDLFEANLARGSENDPAIIAYTSGLNGEPKGVVLSYRNILKLVEGWLSIDTLRPTDEYVSFVSPAAIGELLVTLGLHLTANFIVNLPESDETVQADIREIGPHLVVGPPRFWETLVRSIHLKAEEASRLKRSAYDTFMPAAARAAEARLARGAPPTRPSGLGEFFVLRPIRDSVGLLRTRLAFNLGGSLSPEIVQTLHALGVNPRQIYGLAECGGMATMHRPDSVRIDTVGAPLPETEVRIADDGEILLRGPAVFLGYYDDPAATAEAMAGGWLHTGDAGHLTGDNQLVVVDRLAAVIQLPDGSKQSAQAIENRLKTSPYLSEAMVVGQNRPYVSALLNIDPATVGKWAEAHGQMYASYAELSQLPAVYDLIRDEVEHVNAALPEAVQIRRYIILNRAFSADDGELTRTLKIRRRLIEQRYAGVIEALYGSGIETTVPTEIRYADGRVVQSEMAVRVASLLPEFAKVGN